MFIIEETYPDAIHVHFLSLSSALDGILDNNRTLHSGTGITESQGKFRNESGCAIFDVYYRPTRHTLVTGNLALLQVQALIVGSIAGLFSFAMGTVTHPKDSNSYFESMLMITSSMLCAALSSLVLGTFMCGLVILCRWARINPDNIACPLASSLGDVITLIILATVSHGLMIQMNTFWSTGLFAISVIGIPVFATIVWRNKLVKELLFSGWTPILVAMVISRWVIILLFYLRYCCLSEGVGEVKSRGYGINEKVAGSLAGLVLERYVERYKGLALLVPVLCGGKLYTGRMDATAHEYTRSGCVPYYRVDARSRTHGLQLVVRARVPYGVNGLQLARAVYGQTDDSGMLEVELRSRQLRPAVSKLIEYIFLHVHSTAIIDVVGTTLLVASFATLNGSGLANMEITPEST
ncbi:hypothetical protein BC937DRAFT_95095 [Endogone sp. FLAS-F59071]|nr:hypothetical protein BC937DRAFT_95095 [Endogone sp. FLAS-F59071]|eukprot:RUS13584.1 hypothetical protein BC937DRAFT_95095 [Endogone sp. FLAS-F59071]